MGYGPPTNSGGIGGTTGTADNAIARADGTGGSTLQGSLATIDDSGNLVSPAAVSAVLIKPGTSAILRSTGGALEVTNAAQSDYQDMQVKSLLLGQDAGGDAILVAPAANTLALRNGVNGQSWIVSRTFTDGSNYSQFKTVVTGSVVAFTVSEAGTGIGTLTGYTFDKAVLAPNIPVADTGWTANADSGTKTAIIGSSASNATIGTALDIVTAGAGTLLKNTAEKTKALEAALVALLFPNA